MSAKRYIFRHDFVPAVLQPHPGGEYVKAKDYLELRRILITIEDRHHPDSEWCAEAKEVLG